MKETHFTLAQNANSNPFALFQQWFDEAKHSKEIKDATAFSLATSSKNGRPSTRIVLLKNFTNHTFTFYTNNNSHKGQDINANPQAEACFYWAPLNKQIRIYGNVTKTSDTESDRYFSSRPINSQITACISKQSSELQSYTNFTKEHHSLTQQKITPQRPAHWHGFTIHPQEFEFWLDAPHRVHLRIKYKLTTNTWQHSFLYP